MHRHSTNPLLLSLALVLATATGGYAEKIIFSGRDGRTVHFDFSRQKSLLPPELDEKRVDQTRPEGPASFIPLVDPSYSPNSASRRKATRKKRRERDWIFGGTASQDKQRENREPRLFDEANEESAMMKYLREGDEDDPRSSQEKESEDSDKSDRQNSSRNFDRNGNPMESRRLEMSGGGRDPMARGMQQSTDLNTGLGSDQSISKFKADGLRQQSDIQHREKMSDFRDRFANPFATSQSTAGSSIFGGQKRSPGERLPGVTVSFGDFKTGGSLSSPGVQTFGPRASSPNVPNAFDTRSMPIDFKSGPGFSGESPKTRKREPISLEIRKRDF